MLVPERPSPLAMKGPGCSSRGAAGPVWMMPRLERFRDSIAAIETRCAQCVKPLLPVARSVGGDSMRDYFAHDRQRHAPRWRCRNSFGKELPDFWLDYLMGKEIFKVTSTMTNFLDSPAHAGFCASVKHDA